MARSESVDGFGSAGTGALLQGMGPLRLLAVLLFSACFQAGSLPSISLAQVITNIRPDLSVGTQVDLDVNPGEHHISMGEIRGNGLFQSFETFSLGTGEMARFLDPGVGIEFIFSRVTGVDMMNAFPGSTIDGMLISDIPGADFYFMNPLGIIFGANASLDIGTSMGQPGSAYFTTADYIELAGGFKFNAVPEAIDPDGPLFMPPVTAFGFVSTTPGGITVEGSQLFVFGFDPANPPPDLGLVGGAIDINNGAFLLASGGKLLLAAAASSGPGGAAEVTLPGPDVSPEITGSQRLPIMVSGGATLDATDQAGGAEGRGGTVYIRGGELTLDNASINAFTTGITDGNAVGIDIKVASMTATGVGTKVEAGVAIGPLTPDPDMTGAKATGKGGGVLIDATGGTVTVSDGAEIISSTGSDGTAGPLSLKGGTVEVNGATVATRVQNVGGVDLLSVDANILSVINGGTIITRTDSGTIAGSLRATANQTLLISGSNSSTGARSAIRSFSGGGTGAGAPGTVTVIIGTDGVPGSGRIEAGGRIGGDLDNATQPGLIDVLLKNGSTLTVTGRDAANPDAPSTIRNVSLSAGVPSGPITIRGGSTGGSLIVQDGGEVRSISGSSGSVGDILLDVTNLTVNNGVVSTSTIGQGDAGSIKVPNASSVTVMNNGTITTSTSSTGNAGAIDITTTGNTLTVSNGGSISSSTTSGGNAGAVTITSPALNLNNGTITTSTSSSGNAGSIEANVGTLMLTNNAEIASNSEATASGNAGTVTIQGQGGFGTAANSVTLTSSSLLTNAQGTGAGGDILVVAGSFSVNNASTVSAATAGPQDAGTIGVVTTANTLSLAGGSSLTSSTTSSGNAGEIIIVTPTLSLDNATIATSTSDSGNAGTILAEVGTATLSNGATISSSSTGTATGAAGSVTIEGLASPANAVTVTDSTIATSAANTGQGGSITVDATNLTLNNGTVSASVNNFGSTPDGPAVGLGNIDLTASTMTMTGGTITAETAGTRNAGNITITTTGNTLMLTNNAEIASSSTGTAEGSGKAGSVTIDAGDQFVSSQNSKVTVGTKQADGGDITIKATTLVQLTDSQITATVADGKGKGGNIDIDPQFVILENSSITADALKGAGGNITIVAGTFLMDPASSVTASSAFSAQGTVNINAPVQNISTSLAPLPKNFASAAALLAERCAARAQDAKFSTFVLAGRDGVPPEPGGLLPSPLIAADLSGPAAPTARGAIQDHADAASVTGNSSASLGSGRFVLALADDACGK